MKRFALIITIILLLSSNVVRGQSGTSLPGTCTTGQTFVYTGATPTLDVICSSPNSWIILPLRAGPYVMPDNVNVNLFNVALSVKNTGCTIHTTYSYTVANATQGAVHAGFIVWSIVNQNGVLSSNNVDTGQVFVGTGCGAACDTWSDTISGTTMTGRASFNNTLSVSGSLIYRILSSTCPSVVPF